VTDNQALLRIGFIGAGEMATWAILPALHFAPVRLQAICDIDQERADSAAEKFGARSCYTDYREMFANEDLDALIIQMHPGARQAIVLEALSLGYHVFMPKPPAHSLADAEVLAAATDNAGKCLMVNFQRRFSHGVTMARDLMQSDSFGALSQISCSFCSGLFTGHRGRDYDSPIHAFLLDMAPHHLDLARYLGGEVRKMSLHHHKAGDGVALAIALEYQDGAVATLQLNSNRIWWRNYDRIEITGQGEYIVLDDLWTCKHYTAGGNSFTENWSDERSGELTGDGPCLVEFVSAIREGREPVASIRDAVETMRLYQAVHDAVVDGRDGLIFEQ